MNRRGFVAGVGALALAPRAYGGDEVVISNAVIALGRNPADGPTEIKGGLRIVGGVITELGPGVTGGIDAKGGVVWPGLWDAGTALGLTEIGLEAASKDDAEGGELLQPQVRVVDAFNPASRLIPVVRARGVMGGLVVPGGGLVSGQAAWMRTVGGTVAECTVMAPAGLVIRLGKGGTKEGGPSSRMGVAARLRDVWDANPPKPTPEPVKGKAKPPAEPPKPPTKAELAWQSLLSGELKAIFVADRASDIVLACELAEAYGLDGIILGGAEAWKVAEVLRDAKMPLLLGPVTVQPDNFDTLGARYDNAALLHKAGVRFALRLGDPHRGFDLTTEAGIAVAHGLPREVALAAICGNGPGFFGLTEGRLRVGAEANFVLSDGDPLEPRARVLGVWHRGLSLPLVNHQTELYERFRSL